MKTEVKKLDSTKREISIEVNGDIVKNKFEDVFKKIGQEAKVAGFRPGHAPRDILEKHYSSYAHEQVLKELIPDIYNQAVEKEGLDVIELPNISEVKLDSRSLSFKAQVEIIPEIAVKNYKGLKVNYKKISVSADEIKRNIDTLKESRKVDTFGGVHTPPFKAGKDYAVLSINPEANLGLEAHVIQRVDTVDDNFAKSLGYPQFSELEKAVERQLFIQKENLERQKIENEIVDSITKDLDFRPPLSLVNRQLQDLIKQTKVDLALRGLPREKIEEQENRLSSELEPQAKQQIKVYLVLSAIAKKENIPLDDQMSLRVMEFLLREANWQEI